MKAILHQGTIWKIPTKFKINGIKFSEGPKVSITIDTINHRLLVQYTKGLYYSQLPNCKFMYKIVKDQKISDGHISLKDEINFNDCHIILSSDIKSDYYFSMLLCNADYDKLTIDKTENQIAVIIPYPISTSDTSYNISTKSGNLDLSCESIQDYINKHQTKIYIENLKSIVNLVGINLLDGGSYTSYDNTPYGKNPRFFLNEPIIIGAFIDELSRSFPEIQFYNIPSARDNTKKYNEFIYYDSDIHQEKSPRFNSNIIDDPLYGRCIRSTIPIRFRYETSNIINFMERRNQTLIQKFINSVFEFSFSTDASKYYSYIDKFTFGVNWDRNVIENDVSPQEDQSQRLTYSFNLMCDIHCNILETRDQPSEIKDVLIYLHNLEVKNDRR